MDKPHPRQARLAGDGYGGDCRRAGHATEAKPTDVGAGV